MYALGLHFQHNLYSCLCDLQCFARGRFTPLALYFITPGDGLIHVQMYIPSTAATLASIFATLRKNTYCCMHRQMHPRFQIFELIVSFVVLLMHVTKIGHY